MPKPISFKIKAAAVPRNGYILEYETTYTEMHSAAHTVAEYIGDDEDKFKLTLRLIHDGLTKKLDPALAAPTRAAVETAISAHLVWWFEQDAQQFRELAAAKTLGLRIRDDLAVSAKAFAE